MKTSKEMTDIVFTKMAAYESKMEKRKKLIIQKKLNTQFKFYAAEEKIIQFMWAKQELEKLP